jgi:hypothetical protein
MSGHARERSEQNPTRSSAKSDDDGGLLARDARAAGARIEGCTPTNWRTCSAGARR